MRWRHVFGRYLWNVSSCENFWTIFKLWKKLLMHNTGSSLFAKKQIVAGAEQVVKTIKQIWRHLFCSLKPRCVFSFGISVPFKYSAIKRIWSLEKFVVASYVFAMLSQNQFIAAGNAVHLNGYRGHPELTKGVERCALHRS